MSNVNKVIWDNAVESLPAYPENLFDPIVFSPSYDGVRNTIICGDSRLELQNLPENSIDLIVTSPPYFQQREYNGAENTIGNEADIDMYIDNLMACFVECVRVTKPTGSIVYNLGDKYLTENLLLVPYRFAIKAQDTLPVTLVNDITWVKTNPTPRQYTRRLVSATEPFFHFVLGRDYYYDRQSFFNDVGDNKPVKVTKQLGAKYRTLLEEASMLTQEQKVFANMALDAVIEEVKRGDIVGFRMKIKGIHAEAFGGQEGGRKTQMRKNGFTIIKLKGESMKKDVMLSKVESLPGNGHTAIYPLEIVRELVKMLCPKGGVVLDPYMGSGTTAVAAVMEGRDYIGIDVDATYCESARQRIKEVSNETK